MTPRTLRWISTLLVLSLLAVTSADVVCAWPCAMGAPAPAAAAEPSQHGCHSPTGDPASNSVAPADRGCGLAHGTGGPTAEAAASRSTGHLQPVTTPPQAHATTVGNGQSRATQTFAFARGGPLTTISPLRI